MPRPAVFLLAALFAVGCGASSCSPTAVTTLQPSIAPTTPSAPGFTDAERARFHHLSEGSEVYPVAWLLALTNPADGKPFLDNAERFGLLSDADRGEDNPYGLPIGLTADFTRDLRFAGVKMTGVNCAACHVNELQQGGKAVVRIDGAPNLFDLELFYGNLASATLATIEDPSRAWAFLHRLSQVPQPAGAPLTLVASMPAHTKSALAAYPTFNSLKKGGALEKDLATRIETLHKEERAKPAFNLRKGLTKTADSGPLAQHEKILGTPGATRKLVVPADVHPAAMQLRDKSLPQPDPGPVAGIAGSEPDPTGPWAKLDVPARTTAVNDLLTQFMDTIRLMKARVEYLISLGGVPAGTTPGYGRVDAFGGARNLIFAQKLPLTAPISYPHLWNLNEMKWLHWDQNTTSLLERNVGQALGLGALFDPTTYESTVVVPHLEELEVLSRKIKSPAWPAASFGAIDEAKKTRGRTVFEARCIKCHTDLVPGKQTMPEKLQALDKIGTDPVRADNFARDVNGEKFNVALSDALKKITRKGGGTVSDNLEWRVTDQYGARPLVAAWATAPYLHNNSVPTIYDLLLPADQRPKTFWVGSREYDPKKLGFKSDKAPGLFEFDTTQTGNGNGGHSSSDYGTDMSEDDRMALLEYLKSVQ